MTEKRYINPKNYEPNIPKDIFNLWKKLKRYGDARLIQELTGFSQPIISNALNYGYVKKQILVDKITEFYQNRLNKQTETVKEISKKLK